MRSLIFLGLILAAPVAADPALDAVAASGAEVIFLGEVHDNPLHHDMQADIVTALSPTAIVFEMLDQDEAAIVMIARAAGQVDQLETTLAWADSGWPAWENYAKIMQAAPNAVIVGAEVPRDIARAAFAEGAAAAFGADASLFGLDDPLPDTQQSEREDMQFAAHCDAVPRDILPGFVQAQRLRDARLADAAGEALTNYGSPVVVITGNGHARRDWGAPALLERARPDVTIHALGQFEDTPDDPVPFDTWLVRPPAERDDPYAAFQ